MGGGIFRHKVAPEGGANDGSDHDKWRKPKPAPKPQKAGAKGQPASAAEAAGTSWRSSKQQAGGQPPAAYRATAVAAAAAAPQDAVQTQFSAKTKLLVGGAGGGGAGPSSTPPVTPPGLRGAASGAHPAARVPAGPSSKAASNRSPSPDPEEDDEDLEGFSGLADAAAKVWDELMAQRGAAKDVKSLFYLSELKDGVERAARLAAAARQDAAAAGARLQEKRAALDDTCARMEAKIAQANHTSSEWKLKDVAIRRGKGLCEISMIHHEEDPPYFEVRMASDGSIVGTEAKNLLHLAVPQQGIVRAALRELEDAKASAAAADEAVEKAQSDLLEQHQSLTEQVEQKLTEAAPEPSRSPAAPGPLAPGSAPAGMPDIGLVRGWARPSATEGGQPSAERHEYPDMRGIREDLRGAAGGGGAAAPAPASAGAQPAAPGGGGGATGGSSLAGSGGGGAGPRAAPAGFPSMDDLLRMEKESAAREKQTSASYASAPPSAAREASSRPVTTSTQPPESYRSSTGRSGTRAWSDKGSSQASAHAQERGGAAAGGPRADAAGGAGQPEWTQYRTNEGQPYYHNRRTGESAWSLPVGARCRDPAADQQQQQPQAGQAAGESDPFAHLRKKEEEMRQQRDQWSNWYSEYYQWYRQQSAADPTPPGAAPHGVKFGGGGAAAGGPKGPAEPGGRGPQGPGAGAGASGGGAKAKMPPRGPAPPTLEADFEDHATYAIKSSLLKEMEAMVEHGKPLGQRKKALRVLQIRWHPDKNPDRAEVANSVFQFIEETKPWFLHDPEDPGGAAP